MLAKSLKIRKYPLVFVGNMVETPVLLNIVLNKSFAKKIFKSIAVGNLVVKKTPDSCSNRSHVRRYFTTNDHLP